MYFFFIVILIFTTFQFTVNLRVHEFTYNKLQFDILSTEMMSICTFHLTYLDSAMFFERLCKCVLEIMHFELYTPAISKNTPAISNTCYMQEKFDQNWEMMNYKGNKWKTIKTRSLINGTHTPLRYNSRYCTFIKKVNVGAKIENYSRIYLYFELINFGLHIC